MRLTDMTVSDVATLATALLSGAIFYLSAWVIVRHVRAVRKGARGLIPAHIIAMAVSYNGLVVALLTDERDFRLRFWIYFPSLLLGVWGLALLSREQRRRAHHH